MNYSYKPIHIHTHTHTRTLVVLPNTFVCLTGGMVTLGRPLGVMFCCFLCFAYCTSMSDMNSGRFELCRCERKCV
jgi:hypothetical protein